MSQIFHRDGVVPRDRPRESHPHGLPRAPAARSGSGPTATPPTGSTNTACVLPALNAGAQADAVRRHASTAFEDWIEKRLGIDVTLPMLKTAPAFSLFLNGVANSLILIAGALTATLRLRDRVRLLAGLRVPAAALARLAGHHDAAILADRADPGDRRGFRPCAAALFGGRGARRVDPGARPHQRQQRRPGRVGGGGQPAPRGPREGHGAVRARARPLGDLDRRLPDQRRQGNAGRELHRRARSC